MTDRDIKELRGYVKGFAKLEESFAAIESEVVKTHLPTVRKVLNASRQAMQFPVVRMAIEVDDPDEATVRIAAHKIASVLALNGISNIAKALTEIALEEARYHGEREFAKIRDRHKKGA